MGRDKLAQATHADSHVRDERMESHFALGLFLRWVGLFLFSGFGWFLVVGVQWPVWNFAGSGNGQHVETGGANDATIPPTPVLWQWLFRVPVVVLLFSGRVLSLVSVFGPVSGAGFDDERRVMFDSLSAILGLLPERSVWIIGGDFNAEIGYRGVGEESTLGTHAHGRRTRSGRQMMEWAQGEELRFLLSFSRIVVRSLSDTLGWLQHVVEQLAAVESSGRECHLLQAACSSA